MLIPNAKTYNKKGFTRRMEDIHLYVCWQERSLFLLQCSISNQPLKRPKKRRRGPLFFYGSFYCCLPPQGWSHGWLVCYTLRTLQSQPTLLFFFSSLLPMGLSLLYEYKLTARRRGSLPKRESRLGSLLLLPRFGGGFGRRRRTKTHYHRGHQKAFSKTFLLNKP